MQFGLVLVNLLGPKYEIDRTLLYKYFQSESPGELRLIHEYFQRFPYCGVQKIMLSNDY